MLELLSTPYIIAFALIFVVVLVSFRRQPHPALLDLPWLNTKDEELFTTIRARFRTTSNYRQTLHRAYQQYSKKNESCILASLHDTNILLPASSITWLVSQPDSVLSAIELQKDFLQPGFTFAHPTVFDNPTHRATIKGELTRQLGALTMDIMHELTAGFDNIWGKDTIEWREVCPFQTLMQIIARTSNRIFIGLPWCRNQDLLAHGIGFATSVHICAASLRQLPTLLRPLAALVLARPSQQHAKSFARVIRPEIERRQKLLDSPSGEPEPNDFLQWSIHRARESPYQGERDPDIIAARLLNVNLAAIHTSTFSITNALFDLVASDPTMKYLDQLRAEATAILTADNGIWTKAGLAKMHKADSTLRESTRLSSFQVIGMKRRVMVPEGITAPNGTFCPHGTNIAIPTNGVHNDSAHYPDPGRYDPFRFFTERESITTTITTATTTNTELPFSSASPAFDPKTNLDELIQKANLSFVSTSSPSYHGFGHGRHACPGRFFAANELKLLLSYMVMNYDFQMLETRPESKYIGSTLVPPLKATVRIRRRKENRAV